MSTRKAVNPVDAAWLRMDGPTNAMVITVVFRFDQPLEPSALDATFARLLEHRKFRQRPVHDPRSLTRAAWEDDPDFSLDRHVAWSTLPAPGDEAALEALISERMSTPLDRRHPLWRVDVISGIDGTSGTAASSRGGSALLIRVHHAVGDGVALVRLLLGVSGAGADQKPVEVGVAPPPKVATARALYDRTKAQAETLARLLLLPTDNETPLRGRLGVRKVAAMSKGIPVSLVRALAKHSGGHVNDLLASAVAGAVRSYFTRAGATPRSVRALVPVFIRGNDSDTGNHFGMAYLPLPVEEASRALRLRAVKTEMDAIKSAPDATVAFVVLGAMGLASPTLEKFGIEMFTKKATMLITNVPGPAATVQIGGRDVTSMVVWAPTSGSIGLGFSLLTYDGELRLGVSADANLVGDPHALVDCFEQELEAMRADAKL